MTLKSCDNEEHFILKISGMGFVRMISLYWHTKKTAKLEPETLMEP